MKVMTYNLQSGRDAFGKVNLEGAAEVIARENPDICVLNEVRINCPVCGNTDQPAFYAEKTGMEHRFAHAIDLKTGEYGIALLSKYPIHSFDVYPVPPVPVEQRVGYYEDRVIERAEIETPAGMTAVYGSHFGLSQKERENAVSLFERLIGDEKLPAVFMGDLNMEPNDKLVRRIEALMENTDKTGMLTFPAKQPEMTIDYIFVKGFSAHEAYTINTLASDHLPRVTEIERN